VFEEVCQCHSNQIDRDIARKVKEERKNRVAEKIVREGDERETGWWMSKMMLHHKRKNVTSQKKECYIVVFLK